MSPFLNNITSRFNMSHFFVHFRTRNNWLVTFARRKKTMWTWCCLCFAFLKRKINVNIIKTVHDWNIGLSYLLYLQGNCSVFLLIAWFHSFIIHKLDLRRNEFNNVFHALLFGRASLGSVSFTQIIKSYRYYCFSILTWLTV